MSNIVTLLTTVGSGSYIKPAGATKLIVEAIGGGGAGVGFAAGTPAYSRVGGAGGSYARSYFNVSPAQITYPYIVGFGGAASTNIAIDGPNGQAGGISVFGTTGSSVYLRAQGGQPGTSVGSTAALITTRSGLIDNTVGDIVYPGGSSVGYNLNGLVGGGGGAGSTGPGGDASTSLSPLNFDGGAGTYELGGDGGSSNVPGEAPGNPGNNYGGGGSSVVPVFGGSNIIAGSGAQGVIRVTLVYEPSIPKIEWNGNTLIFGYPLDNVITYSSPIDGYQNVRIENGDEYSWIPGRNYILECDIRWIPSTTSTNPSQTGWNGSTGWRAFLEYARAKNKFTFYPDYQFSNVSVESYLVDPIDGQHELEPDGTRKLRLVIRNNTTPYDGF